MAYTYQWELCDSAGAGCVDITGATGTNYIVAAGDVGSTVRVRVSDGTNNATSNPTSVIGGAVTGLYTLNVQNGKPGLGSPPPNYQDASTVSDVSITRGDIEIGSAPDGYSPCVSFALPTATTPRAAAEILFAFTPILGRIRYVAQSVFFPTNWTARYAAESGDNFDSDVCQLQYAGLHGVPIGMVAHKDRIAFVIETGNSTFGQNSEFQNNLIGGGGGGPGDYPSCLGVQTGRPGEGVSAAFTLGVWHDFVIEFKEEWDFTGYVKVWHRVHGVGSYLLTYAQASCPTHQYHTSWSAFGRNDKYGYYAPSQVGAGTIYQRLIGSFGSFADATAFLG